MCARLVLPVLLVTGRMPKNATGRSTLLTTFAMIVRLVTLVMAMRLQNVRHQDTSTATFARLAPPDLLAMARMPPNVPGRATLLTTCVRFVLLAPPVTGRQPFRFPFSLSSRKTGKTTNC